MTEIVWTWAAVFAASGIGMALLSCFVGLRAKGAVVAGIAWGIGRL